MLKTFWLNNKKILKHIAVIFIVWQLVILAISLISPYFVSKRDLYVYSERGIPDFLSQRANFDGIHYLSISQKGYGYLQQAFFPFYPSVIKFIAPLFGGKLLFAGLFISNFCFLVALFIFYKLVRLDFGEQAARRSLIFLLVFPTSFFFGTVYTESLFLMLVLGSFYAARKNKWFLSAILGSFASYTRIVGILLLPALIYERWNLSANLNLKARVKNFLPLIILPLGLLKYMFFLWNNFKDPFMFFHVQPLFGAERSGNKIILLYQVFWRYLKMILTTKIDPLYFAVWLEFLIAIGAIILLFFCYKKKIQFSYLFFASLAYLLPTLTGTFSSLPRYFLALFPCFIILGTIRNKVVYKLILIGFSLLFIISCSFFLNGIWIS